MKNPTNKHPRIKPLAAKVSLIGEHAEPGLHLGEITLHPTYRNADLVWLAGVLIRDGRPIASLNLNAVPVSAFPASPPPGRPPETSKHKAVFLSWVINLEREGKKGLADELTRERFNYSDPKKVRDIRVAEGDLPYKLVFKFDEERQAGYACWIENPTFMLADDGHLTILGIAWSWHESWEQQATYGEIRLTAQMENINTETMNDLLGRCWPIIIVAY